MSHIVAPYYVACGLPATLYADLSSAAGLVQRRVLVAGYIRVSICSCGGCLQLVNMAGCRHVGYMVYVLACVCT